MWLFDLLGIGGSEKPKPRRKRKERTQGDIILDAMLANQGIKTFWKTSDFQHGEYFVGYKAPSRISELRRAGLIENGPKDGRFQTYRLTQKGIEFKRV